jgi:tetratricopeptide (TPR) repeat protein
MTDSARTAFERAVRIAPRDALALANLGALYVNLGRSAEAIPVLRDAVAIRPDYVDALANLALALFRVDSLREARTAAERALAIDPGNALARQVMLATE